jgi:hypothetical protein
MDTDGSQGRKNGGIFSCGRKMLKGHQDKPEERKSNPIKGKKTAIGKDSQEGGGFNQGLTQRFEQPKDALNLTPAKKEEQSKRLRRISTKTPRARKK